MLVVAHATQLSLSFVLPHEEREEETGQAIVSQTANLYQNDKLLSLVPAYVACAAARGLYRKHSMPDGLSDPLYCHRHFH